MRCEILAVGSELLLGQIVDTNSQWMGEQLAAAGIDCLFQAKVGDNHARVVTAIGGALDRSDALVCCGGLGPTHDDITRGAIAEVMGARLVRDPAQVDRITQLFEARKRVMPVSNHRQADLPFGAKWLPNLHGTAAGLCCPIRWSDGKDKVIYAVPGVPGEMRPMVGNYVIPDLVARSGKSAVIRSRVLRTWGLAESALAERLQARIEDLEVRGPGAVTIALLASGMEGIKVRLTVRAADETTAARLLADEEVEIRAELGQAVFGVDDDTMESVVGRLLEERGLSLGLAESVTGGLIGARITNVAGASDWFRGGVISYATSVKQQVLGVPPGPVISGTTAEAMAEGARRVLGSDIGLGITGVAGPDLQEGQQVGTVFVGLAGPWPSTHVELHLPGTRRGVRELGCISALDSLRRHLLGWSC